MAQRLVRAKNKIKAAQHPVPGAGRRRAARPAARRCSPWSTSSSTRATRHRAATTWSAADLCAEAIRLGPAAGRADAGRARGARAAGAAAADRVAPAGPHRARTGSSVLLADQDRSRWDRELIAEGQALVRGVPAPQPARAVPDPGGDQRRAHRRRRPPPTPTGGRSSRSTTSSRRSPDAGGRAQPRRRRRRARRARRPALADGRRPATLRRYHLFHATRADLLRAARPPRRGRRRPTTPAARARRQRRRAHVPARPARRAPRAIDEGRRVHRPGTDAVHAADGLASSNEHPERADHLQRADHTGRTLAGARPGPRPHAAVHRAGELALLPDRGAVGARRLPAGRLAVDAAVTWLISTFVDGRAFPMFGLLFGYGVAQIVSRQTGREPAGGPPPAVAAERLPGAGRVGCTACCSTSATSWPRTACCCSWRPGRCAGGTAGCWWSRRLPGPVRAARAPTRCPPARTRRTCRCSRRTC